MQTKPLYLVSGIPKWFPTQQAAVDTNQGDTMSNTASIRLSPSTSRFGRLFATIDRLLLAYAEMEIRNGSVPRCGI